MYFPAFPGPAFLRAETGRPIRLSACPNNVVSIFCPAPVRSRAYRAAQTAADIVIPEAVSISGLDQTQDGTLSTVLVSEAIIPVIA